VKYIDCGISIDIDTKKWYWFITLENDATYVSENQYNDPDSAEESLDEHIKDVFN
jgi:hypothetical protein